MTPERSFAACATPGRNGAPTTLLLTRPLLDAILRRRLRALGNVSFATECDVTGLCVDRAGNVTGVVVLRTENGETSLAGDLVVDAMGRGSRSASLALRVWLRRAQRHGMYM